MGFCTVLRESAIFSATIAPYELGSRPIDSSLSTTQYSIEKTALRYIKIPTISDYIRITALLWGFARLSVNPRFSQRLLLLMSSDQGQSIRLSPLHNNQSKKPHFAI